MGLRWLLALVLSIARLEFSWPQDFSSTHLYVSPSETQTEVQIQLDFRNTNVLNGSDVIYVQLPRFTSGGGGKEPGPNFERGNLVISPSVYFEGQWIEGAFNDEAEPFQNSTLVLYVKEQVRLNPGTSFRVRVYKRNNIRVYCGFEDVSETDDQFSMRTNSSAGNNLPFSIEKSDTVGNGCSAQSDCAGKGVCDFCKERCMCYSGHGSSDNMRQIGSVDCSLLECPMGPAWANLPISATDGGHGDQVLCSGGGLCAAELGECECFTGFTGDACQRRVCANDGCGDNGQCLTMHALAMREDAFPLSRGMSSYGADVSTRGFRTWDWDVIQGCKCDSAWAVGLDAHQTQTAEWFGADCSLRHCPTGIDPSSRKNKTDCANVTVAGNVDAGGQDNLCFVECAGRGICDYGTGKCRCFAGYDGEACDRLIGNAAAVG